ncbi:sensor histidine kinase [Gordonia sp. NPDC003504]
MGEKSRRRYGLGSRRGVRARSTVAAAVVVTVALGIAGVVSLLMLHRANTEAMYRATSRQAYQVATAVARTGVDGVDPDDLAPGAGVDFVQVVDREGRVLRASPGAPDIPVADFLLDDGIYSYRDDLSIRGFDGEYCATALGAEFGGRYYAVIAVDRTNNVRRSEWITAAIIGVELPIIVALAALAVYLLVGRTLRPVSRITRQVNAINASRLDRRVPVPDADDEIRTLATTMNSMLARLQVNRGAQLRFVGDASHELRSPLTTVLGLLDLADETGTALDPETVRTILLPEARQMQRIVSDLLLLARADENGLTVTRVDVDLDDAVLSEAQRVRAMGSVDVRTRVIAARVLGDPVMVARALRNLVDNAIRYARSTLWILMFADDEVARIVVGDDGPGIDGDDRRRVFERFARLGTDRRSGSGTGLGLAIVQEIMVAHGGSVSVLDDADVSALGDAGSVGVITGAAIELRFRRAPAGDDDDGAREHPTTDRAAAGSSDAAQTVPGPSNGLDGTDTERSIDSFS